MRLLQGALGLVALLGPLAAQAAAGQVLFALGRVEIQRGGQAFVAQRGTTVEVGDTIATGPTGLTQVRLKDGALLSLRYGSAMVVQEFRLPETPAATTTAPAVTAAPSASTAGGRSVLRLLRGAFRTVTGLIGKNVNDAYSVVTPVATIGIRGTDYAAAYCSGDCGTTPDGLYVGVSNGEIELVNDSGALVLANDQYGYVKDSSTPPDQTLAPPEALETPIEQGGEGEEEDSRDAETTAAAEDGAAPDAGFGDQTRTDKAAEVGDAQPEGDYELRPGRAGGYAFVHGTTKGADDDGFFTDDSGGLIGFVSGEVVSIGTASNVNRGADADFGTALRWGRWTGGTANVGSSPIDLRTQSLHWIYAASPAAIALRTTGFANYALIGNTDPTDDAGNTGFLGSASLQADFDNQTVFSSVNVGINNQVWVASGSGTMETGTALFSGGYSVGINDAGGTPVDTGTGGFAGFFTNNAGGAGLSFELTSSTATVSGAAAFVVQPGGQ